MTAVQIAPAEVVAPGAGGHRGDSGPATGGGVPRRWPGLVAAALGLGGALLAHRFVPAIGVLTWAVALGMIAGNTGLLPRVAKQALAAVTKRLLRVGIVLLGFAVSFGSIMALGVGTVALVAGTLVTTLVVTTWLGNRMKLGAARSLLIGTGFAICGASAIAAMEDTAGGDEEDVAVGIAMVTLFGTVAMVLLPLLAGPLGLTDMQFGIWAGASIHEVGQVVAAAGAGGAAVVAIAVVVKLTRVLLLAPVVATVSIRKRMAGQDTGGKRPPIVPLFVLGFLACVALRSTGVIPTEALAAISQVQVAALGAALFGMGAAVQIRSLCRGSGRVLLVSTLSTLLVTGLALAGVLVLGAA
ncbi:MAG: putative sulfate exporter family transporter [Blastococcus sp.]